MATKAPNPIPEGMTALIPNLYFDGNCGQAIELYQKALGAELDGPPFLAPDGVTVWHAVLRIAGAPMFVSDLMAGGHERGPEDGVTASIMFYVADCDGFIDRAHAAGFEIAVPPTDHFWGDRMGRIRDPFGHTFAVGTHKWVYSPEEMEREKQKWLESLGK